MKLNNVDLLKLLPHFMRDDGAVIGFSKAMDNIIQYLESRTDELKIWTSVDDMSEEELDELAWEMNISWYLDTADLETKRKLVRHSQQIHGTLGTKWAIEQIIGTYFGDGYVSEWFEYGGEPGFFRITSSNAMLVLKNYAKFLAILGNVKRKSSWLEAIKIEIQTESPLHAGGASHDVYHILSDTTKIESVAPLYSGATSHEVMTIITEVTA